MHFTTTLPKLLDMPFIVEANGVTVSSVEVESGSVLVLLDDENYFYTDKPPGFQYTFEDGKTCLECTDGESITPTIRKIEDVAPAQEPNYLRNVLDDMDQQQANLGN